MIACCASWVEPSRADEPFVRAPNARRLVDRQLLGDREMHRQMQERIGLAAIRRVVGLGGVGIGEFVLIFRMLDDPVGGDALQRRQDFALRAACARCR